MYSKETLLELLRKKVCITQADEPIFGPRGERPTWLFDFRRVFLNADVLESLAVLFWEEMESAYPFQVGGMESASIPLITAIVLEGKKRGAFVNGFYIRKSRKKVGLLRHIEGELNGESVILVDDLINNGNTFKKQVVLLEESGHRVTDIFAIVRFREKAHYHFLEDHGVTIHDLFTLEHFNLSLKPSVPIRYNQFTVRWRLDGREPDLHRVTRKPQAVCDATTVYFPTDDGYVYALDQATGEKKWRFKTGLTKRPAHRISDLSLVAHTLYFSTLGGKIIAVDTTDGKTKWVCADADRIDSAPCVSSRQQKVYAVANRGWFLKKNFLLALDLHTGDEALVIPLPDYSRVQPALTVSENALYIGCENGTMLCIGARSGTVLWTQTFNGAIVGISTDSRSRDNAVVYVVTKEGRVFKLRARTGVIENTVTLEGPVQTTPLVTETGLVVTGLDKYVYNLDLETLAPLWSYETAGRIFADPAFVSGHLYVGSNDARLYEIEPSTGKVTGITQATERITTPLLFCPSTGYYFLTTYANELYCLSRRENPD